MIYKIDHVIRLVRIALRRNRTPPRLIQTHDADTIGLDEILMPRIVAAVREVYATAPMHIISESARDIDSDIFWYPGIDDTFSGHILLPDDFQRLMIFEMSDWSMPVTEAITPDSALYSTWHSQYSGVRGTPYHPRCRLSDISEGRALEFQSCLSTDAKVVQAKYIPYSHIDRYGGIEIAKSALQTVIDKTITPNPDE